MAENSFDVVSKVDLQEASNAIQNALKEVHTRFDLKDSKSDIQLEGKDAIVLSSKDEYKLKDVTAILQSKLLKRAEPSKPLPNLFLEPPAGTPAAHKPPIHNALPRTT